jgi:hypothetical protein
LPGAAGAVLSIVYVCARVGLWLPSASNAFAFTVCVDEIAIWVPFHSLDVAVGSPVAAGVAPSR